ncbi:MAG: TetR family transcriptional regulator C-terminal domain-containing protein [Chloroflexota bacterium]
MSKQATKQLLLEVGTAYIIEHGYHHSGLNEILTAAQVPKGSFYYYFNSKEELGLQLLTRFAEHNFSLLQRFLDDQSLLPLDRLRCYFEYNVDYLASFGFRRGCLIGNLGQEMADLSEVMRQHIDTIMYQWASCITTGLQQAQQQGQIDSALDTQELGNFCLNSWQGAMLRMKVTKDAQPLHAFIHLFFDVMLN